MNLIDANTVCLAALAFHDYPIAPERAAKLAVEINGYLATLERLQTELGFDDAPADFVLALLSYADA